QGRSGDDILVSAHGQTYVVPAARSTAPGVAVIVGVRPEKMTVLDAADGHRAPDAHNKIAGRVTDVSYAGVSTQYLVRTPWDQELTVFEQNVIVGDRCAVGDEVLLHWATEHTFGLDGAQDVHAGVLPEVLDLEAAASALESRGA
ncbi:MAG: TOBE domain-containing protein, partial [Candidatus Nanopelagicales bacterium]|nr:TOBE domain-containing protein [Candidatus Nanopelagicales bacterium]